MRRVVHRRDLLRRGQALTRETRVRPQRDGRDRQLAARVPRHRAHRLVVVGVDAEPALERDRQEPQHVATGQGGDEGFLRIHGGRVRHGRRYHDLENLHSPQNNPPHQTNY